MQKRLFFKNAVILTATSIILRMAGIFFRIYISNSIGSEGMGLHQLIFSIYMFTSALASSGVGIAVTRLVAENGPNSKNAVRHILSKALTISIILGALAFGAMFFCADICAERYLRDMRAALSLKILSLGLPFMAISSCLKGYFLARRKASTPSNSMLFEQAVRIIAVVFLLRYINTNNLSLACAAVVVGNVVSEIFACLYIYIGYVRDKNTLPDIGKAPKNITRSLFRIFIPTALASYINTILHTIENVTVPDALMRYTLSRTDSLSQFGTLKAMALPILFFPSSFLGSVSSLLLPEVASDTQKSSTKAMHKTICSTISITSVSSFLVASLFWVYAYEIGQIIYKSTEAGFYMKVLSPIIPFMYMESIITGILSGLDQQMSLLRYNVYNSVMRITLITIFVPYLGINAFLFIMIISNVFTSCISIHRLIKVTGICFDTKTWVIKPFFCALACLVCAYMLKNVLFSFFSNIILSFLAGALIMCLIYLLLIRISGCIDMQINFKERKIRC